MQITVPDNFVATVGSNSTTFFSGVSGVVTLIFGILLAFFILDLIVSRLRDTNDDI